MTPEERARLRALAEAATPGPWYVDPDERPGMAWNNHICAGPNSRVAFMANDGTPANPRGISNAALIVAAVNALPALLDALDAAERERDAGRAPDGKTWREAMLEEAERRGAAEAERDRLADLVNAYATDGVDARIAEQSGGVFAVGQRVEKHSGDYQLAGEVRAAFTTRAGKVRYVVEHEPGFLHIYGEANLRPLTALQAPASQPATDGEG